MYIVQSEVCHLCYEGVKNPLTALVSGMVAETNFRWLGSDLESRELGKLVSNLFCLN